MTINRVALAIARLRREGWRVGELDGGEFGCRSRRLVCGTDGLDFIWAEGTTSAEAWAGAIGQARAMGVLAGPGPGS